MRGFTLVELLVALTVMALLAIMSWRGLDGMTRAQAQTQARADEVLALQAGLAQWGADLDAIAAVDRIVPLDWDGRALRITRRGTVAGPGDGLRVVAWSRRALPDGNTWWLRWESAPIVGRAQWNEAWQQAALWAQNPGEDLRRREVPVVPATDWQLFYYRNNAWTNPLSSDAGTTPPLPGTPAVPGSTAAAPGSVVAPALPDGVRLVLALAPGRAIAGTLVRDWVQPTVGGNKS
ncbi:prepilin-type N-terminal cleavage/methylation domain-containing protein [uncultured Xylophilus sp.]|uniref:PulJ/GspJ family protein n=1 Tax=uncultured Xylophilus sp. TaxID=296832 RepID=UPI0025D04958|nr:prepilin-type N-terminal cleavage/methylation domain-containing protein [uncultured Xylophilus sp.]